MWRGVGGSLGPCGCGGIAGLAVGSQWCSLAASVYRAAQMMCSACSSRTMWRSVLKSSGVKTYFFCMVQIGCIWSEFDHAT